MPKKILIVDDEKDVVLLLNAALRKKGYEVLSSFDPVQAFSLAIHKQPDLVITDIMMPAGGGDGFYDNLRNHPATSTIPVIFITAHGGDDMRKAAMDSGAADFLTKPIDMNQLLSSIQSIFSRTE